MYITPMDVINFKISQEGRLSADDILRHVIAENESSKRLKVMRDGERYYNGDHDILQHDFQKTTVYETDADGRDRPVQIENKNNSNERLVHNFYRHHVDQKIAYFLGRPPVVSVEGAAKDPKLKEYEDAVTAVTTDELFQDVLMRSEVEASNKTVAWLHTYYDSNNTFRYVLVPSEEVLAYYDADHQNDLTVIIRYWTIDVVRGDKVYQRKKVEWWTPENVSYYEEDDYGHYVLSPDVKVNPAPHWWGLLLKNGKEIRRDKNGWGRVPFIRIDNNSAGTNDLSLIRGLQDAYNLLSSKATNTQIDMAELYWIVQGYGGETAKAILKKLQYNKTVNITDPSGSVRSEQAQLSVSERLSWLGMLRRDIYHLGRAFDESPETVGNATNVALKLQYQNFDLKADPAIAKLKLALKEFFWFWTEDYNRRNGTDYDSSLVRVDFKKSQVINDTETIDNILASRGFVPDTILMAQHPFVDDAGQALEDLKAQKAEEAKTYKNDDV